MDRFNYKPQYFTFDEFLNSQVAAMHNIFNIPTWWQIENLYKLALRLDSVRQKLGMPIYINSGFRNRYLNEIVGGVPNSYHMHGRAADITCKDNEKLLEILKQYDWIECINYDYQFIHVAL